MSHAELDALLGEIRRAREATLAVLADLTEDDFATPTDMARWDDVRRVLLRFGDHMREHANQLEATRAVIGRGPTMPQRMLAESEQAWGKLLAATVGLDDRDVDTLPADGSWSVRQLLHHILEVELRYLDAIRRSRR
jgi:hypothetical protein